MLWVEYSASYMARDGNNMWLEFWVGPDVGELQPNMGKAKLLTRSETGADPLVKLGWGQYQKRTYPSL